MCLECYDLFLFQDGTLEDYRISLADIRERVQYRELILSRGNCPLDQVEQQLEAKSLFLLIHSFHCVSCSQGFALTACIRGQAHCQTVES